MKDYYVNTNSQTTGEHEVHSSECCYLPSELNRIYLGSFLTNKEAVEKAKYYYHDVDGCYFCCNDCHTR